MGVNLAILRYRAAGGWRGIPRFWSGWRFGWLEAAFLALALLALGMRLWELNGRAMHYDEAIHLHFSWVLYRLEGFIHSPWMHGPFQIELTALMLGIFGDSDFAARLGYALFGAALVGLPYFFRHYLGRAGSLCSSVMLMLSPALLYFSRFGRNDIIMVFLAVLLLVLMWRYVNESRDRYLYLASAVLAVMFATKETSYFVVLIFGGTMFVLALPQLVPGVLGRVRLDGLAGPAGFLLLMFTLTLPQGSSAIGIFQDYLGLMLVNPDPLTGQAVANPDGTQGLVGGPAWAGVMVTLPLVPPSWWLPLAALLLVTGGLFFLTGRPHRSLGQMIPRIGVPVASVVAVYLAIFRPFSFSVVGDSSLVAVDFAVAGVVVVLAVVALLYWRHSWRRGALLLGLPALLATIFSVLFTPIVNVDTLVNGLLPAGITVDASANVIPLNYLVAAGVLTFTSLLSVAIGVAWRGGVWLACAAIFYIIWVALYTTIFTNWTGIFSGVWQGMGYWLAQQDVARGNQPWYYYLVGISVYELLPVLAGVLGAIYYLRKEDILGLVLALWAGANLLAYTVASEKMPWLLVNITVPFILLGGRALGDLVERVPWGRVARNGSALLLVLAPLSVAIGVYLVWEYVDVGSPFAASQWGLLILFCAALVLAAYLVRLARPPFGAALVALGLAGALLAFGTWTAWRAAYTYDDSNKELLVYAQGSAHLPQTFQQLDRQVFRSPPQGEAVRVDYDLWFPFQWYVRHQEKQGTLAFSCFKKEGEEGWHSGCVPANETPEGSALLVDARRSAASSPTLGELNKEGPLRNLLWFPETYRRPGEDRGAEEFDEQLVKDFQFFGEAAASRDKWRAVLDYVLLRRMENDWFASEYYSYLP